jgi:hypothetical protein
LPQNYTCNHTSPTSAPALIGALATLYNASSIAATYPDIFSLLPDIALQFSTPANVSGAVSPSGILGFSDSDVIGHHFFSTPTTPVFDLKAANAQFGEVFGVKAAEENAPSGAPKGQAQVNFGAVPWLKLTAGTGSTGDVMAVYRVNTAGGNPPKTCEGMPSLFTVEYAAEYWFWGADNSNSSTSNSTSTRPSATAVSTGSLSPFPMFTGGAAAALNSTPVVFGDAASLLDG